VELAETVACVWLLRRRAAEAIRLSWNLSFDEAFTNAVINRPPSDAILADASAWVDVVEIGSLFQRFADWVTYPSASAGHHRTQRAPAF
jgi:hypothetical protein